MKMWAKILLLAVSILALPKWDMRAEAKVTISPEIPKAKSGAGTAYFSGWVLKERVAYDLSKGANLEAAIDNILPGQLDDLKNRSDFPIVLVRISRADGKNEIVYPDLLKMTKAQREAVLLHDGEIVNFSVKIITDH